MAAVASLCVFCGSQTGRNPAHAEAARSLGTALAQRGITLVYGAGGIGLMGVVADAVLAEGGKVVGVIPKKLESLEVAHPGADRDGGHRRTCSGASGSCSTAPTAS